MIVVVSLILMSTASLAWQSMLSALLVEMAAAWLLTVLPTPRLLRRYPSS
ncbi:hypothetical protein ACFU9Y_25790 [Streptomyces sp. NPDC057621]